MSPGFDPGEPFSGAEIAAAMVRLHEESERYLAAIPAAEFAAPQGEKWSPADHVRHLAKSTFPLVPALGLPKLLLGLRFGRAGSGLARLRRPARRLSQAPAGDRRHRRTVRAVGAAAAGRPRGLAARSPRLVARRGLGARREDPGLERARRSIATACRIRCSASSRCARCSSSPSTTTPITSSWSPAAAEAGAVPGVGAGFASTDQEAAMPKFVIEREIPGAGKLSAERSRGSRRPPAACSARWARRSSGSIAT